MSINFTRKAYLEVWRDNEYISRHTSLIEAGESASRHADDYGSGDYYITIGGPPQSFTQIMADGLPHNVQAGKVYYMARADVTIRFAEGAPTNAYLTGAQASAASSAVSASSVANDIAVPITGAVTEASGENVIGQGDPGTLLFNGNFETGDATQWTGASGTGWDVISNGEAYEGLWHNRLQVVQGSTNSGPGYLNYGTPGNLSTQVTGEFWSQFRSSFDSFTGGWPSSDQKLMIYQWYDVADGSFSNQYRKYQVVLAVHNGGKYYIELLEWGPNDTGFVNQNHAGSPSNDYGPADSFGSWDTFRIRIVPDTNGSGSLGEGNGNGIIQVWLNNELIIDYSNVNIIYGRTDVGIGRLLPSASSYQNWVGSTTYQYWDEVQLATAPGALSFMPSSSVPRVTPPSSFLWDLEADGFTGGFAENAYMEFEPEINREVIRMNYASYGEQLSMGGGVRDDVGNVLDNPIADAGQFNLRYLIRFGTGIGQPEWSATGNYSYEIKFPDINTGDTSTRMILMQRPARFDGGPRDVYNGSLVMTIGQPGGTIQQNIPQAGATNPDRTWGECFSGSGIWHYLEVQVNDDGSTTYWWGPYDGTGTEYTQGSPNAQHPPGSHNFNFDNFRINDRWDFGYRNHAPGPSAECQIDAHYIIHNSFIGPD